MSEDDVLTLDDLKKEWGEKLREIRQDNGLVMRQVAERCDLSISYIGEIERGLRDIPPVDTVQKIVEAINADSQQRFELAKIDLMMFEENFERKYGYEISESSMQFSDLMSD